MDLNHVFCGFCAIKEGFHDRWRKEGVIFKPTHRAISSQVTVKRANEAEQLAHFAVTHSPKKAQQLLKPHSASAPNSPRVPRRAPLPITVTSSATLKVTQPGQDRPAARSTSRHLSQNRQSAAVRERSKSPNPRG